MSDHYIWLQPGMGYRLQLECERSSEIDCSDQQACMESGHTNDANDQDDSSTSPLPLTPNWVLVNTPSIYPPLMPTSGPHFGQTIPIGWSPVSIPYGEWIIPESVVTFGTMYSETRTNADNLSVVPTGHLNYSGNSYFIMTQMPQQRMLRYDRDQNRNSFHVLASADQTHETPSDGTEPDTEPDTESYVSELAWDWMNHSVRFHDGFHRQPTLTPTSTWSLWANSYVPADDNSNELHSQLTESMLEQLGGNQLDDFSEFGLDSDTDTDSDSDTDSDTDFEREPTYTPFAKRTLVRADEHTLRLVTGRICSVCHEHMIIHVNTGCTIAPKQMCHECMVQFVTTQTKMSGVAHCPCGAKLTGLDLILTPGQMAALEETDHRAVNIDPELLDVMASIGAQRCGSCGNVVEKTEGCNHIVCICKYEFCYSCGEKWQNSDCTRNCDCPMFN